MSKYSVGFQSQENETSIDELAVEGNMPDWLRGTLVRPAPSKFEVGKSQYKHWFDGLSMLHKFTFDAEKVSYACKFLESKAYKKAMEKNKIVYGEFGTDPCRDLFQKVFTFFKGPKITDNGSVNINWYGHDFTANTETTRSVKFNLKNLSTKGLFTLGNDVRGQVTITHPHYDKDGTLYSYLTNFGYNCEYNIFSQSPGSDKRKLIASVPTDRPAYMHSMGMTKKHVILTEFPLVCIPLQLRFGIRPFIENYKWKPERGVRTHLVDKKTGRVLTVKTDPYFAFHHVNAFEEDGEVVFDVIGYKDVAVIDQLYLEHLRSDKPTQLMGKLWRFRISSDGKKVSRKEISDAPIELPRTHYRRINAERYQYVYGAGNTVQGNFFDNITKIDVTTGREEFWHEKNCYPGEPIFVEKPHSTHEDDGILLTIVLDASSNTSFLLVLDAQNLKEIARARVPQHIPFGFHGQYVYSETSIPVYH